MPTFVPNTTPLDPDWIAGFMCSDGSFGISIKRKKDKTYFNPDIRIVQHNRSISVLERIQLTLGGSINPNNKAKTISVLRITSVQTI
jgi:hypothetical protein